MTVTGRDPTKWRRCHPAASQASARNVRAGERGWLRAYFDELSFVRLFVVSRYIFFFGSCLLFENYNHLSLNPMGMEHHYK